MSKRIEYAKDASGLTVRITETVHGDNVTVECEIANDLFINVSGRIEARPFKIPLTTEQIERERRIKFISGCFPANPLLFPQ